MQFVFVSKALGSHGLPRLISRSPVSVAQFAQFLHAADIPNFNQLGDYVLYNPNNPELPIACTGDSYSFPSELADHPVTGVTLQGALSFCDWAGCRMLFHREWKRLVEYEGLAKDQLGDWYRHVNVEDRFGRVLPSGSLLSDRLGLVDLIGNVASWCLPDDVTVDPHCDLTDLSVPVVGCAYNKAHSDSDRYWTYHRWARTGAVGVSFRCVLD